MKTRFPQLQMAIPFFCCLLTLSFTAQSLQAQSLSIWTDKALSTEQAAQVEATSFRALELDASALQTLLKRCTPSVDQGCHTNPEWSYRFRFPMGKQPISELWKLRQCRRRFKADSPAFDPTAVWASTTHCINCIAT